MSIDWKKTGARARVYIEWWSLLCVVVFALIPVVLAFVMGADFSRPVEPAYIAGCITAQGVILGFLSRFVTSKKMRKQGIGFIILLDFSLFLFAVHLLLVNAVNGTPANVMDLAIMIAALAADTATLALITTLEWANQSQSEDDSK